MCNEDHEKKFEGQEPWFYQFKKVLLAGMGAVAMAQEEMEGFVGKMVEKGEIAEQEGKKLVKELMDRGRKQTKDAVNMIEGNGIEGLTKLFSLLNIPSKKDLEELSKRVEELSNKIEGIVNKDKGKEENKEGND